MRSSQIRRKLTTARCELAESPDTKRLMTIFEAKLILRGPRLIHANKLRGPQAAQCLQKRLRRNRLEQMCRKTRIATGADVRFHSVTTQRHGHQRSPLPQLAHQLDSILARQADIDQRQIESPLSVQ